MIERHRGAFDDGDERREERARERRQLRTEITDHPNPILYVRLVGSYLSDGRAPDAAHVCEEGLGQFPSHGELYRLLGELLLSAGEGHLARRHLLQAVQHDEFNYHALTLLAETDLRVGYVREAASIARRILSFLPGDGKGRELLRRAEERIQ